MTHDIELELTFIDFLFSVAGALLSTVLDAFWNISL